ncbi:hypothetical protein [Algoriphagus aquimarinus]|uniref:DUF4221 domain-containing protein n=1 Tax=Algoriphagus aquimarinus TaxID=237018 RepID=A0A5C7AUV9_9BACT|nr:hypothetical protein [Algoriphagus aquimarinus]TXE12137.1 hypothetical protein ESV85_08815 [Algoriphagus aquimarinus]
MKKLFLRLIFIGLIFSCDEKGSEEIYQGKLQELIVGDFSLEKDSLTKYIFNIRVVEDNSQEYISFTKPANIRKEWVFALISTISGKEAGRIEIPTEGPESMRGGIHANIVVSENQVFQINHLGEIGEYNGEGKKIALYNFFSDYKAKLNGKGGEFPLNFEITQFNPSIIQLGNNPSKFLNTKKPVAAGEMMTEFPLDFKNWITHVDLETGEVENSDFSMPEGYEVFKNDNTASVLFGAYDSKRDLYYLAWPYSDEVYVLNGVKMESVVKPFSSVEFNYFPSERKAMDLNTVLLQPKNASKQLFLLYDEQRDLIIRCSKIEESGASESTFERTKHYVLSINSGEWESKGEYFFDFETEIEVENWFLTSEGLFINKPEQESEDEYEFYKIDLSGFEK